jgi:hypothetical protein
MTSSFARRMQIVLTLSAIFGIVRAMVRAVSDLTATSWSGLGAVGVGEVLMPFVVPTVVVGALLYWLSRLSAQPTR